MKSRRKFINKLDALGPNIVTSPSPQTDSLNMSQSHLIEPCLEEEMIELFDVDAYLQDYLDVRDAFTPTKKKMMGKPVNVNPLQIFNHYLQYGRNEGRKAYCIRQNGEKVLYDGFNFEAYNKVCESGYNLRVNNELNGYIHYLNTIKTNPKPLLLHVKSYANVFPEPLKNQGFIAMLQHEWTKFDAWKYKKDHGKNGSAKELFIDYVSSNFDSLIAPMKEAERKVALQTEAKPKVCIIYVYYERKNEQKNQTNLAFFIKYGLDKSRWRNIDVTTLFILNGHQCEVLIPERDDINVLKQDNCSDWEGWYNGIKYFEDKYKKPIDKNFSHLCLMNASCFGPVYEDGINMHWLDPFFTKLKTDNSIICSPISNILPSTDLGGPGRRVVPHFSLIKIDKQIMNLLLNTKIYSYLNNTEGGWYNTILGHKPNKIDAVLTGEYGFSKIFLDNNYNISSLVTGNNNNRIDFYNENNHILENSIFIKNVWRWEGNNASQPVLYNFCNNFMQKKLNYFNEFENYSHLNNYEPLNKNNGKMIISYNLPIKEGESTYWNSNKDFYNKFGYAEQPIIFPIKKNNKNSVIFAHYDEDNILKEYVINSLKILMLLEYDIIFYTASPKILNIDSNMLPFEINYIKNIGAGTDWYVWLSGLKQCEKYERILFMNDSLILGINGIENMRNSIQKMRNKNYDLWGHWSSTEVRNHYVGTPIEIKQCLRNEMISFIELNIPKCNNGWDFVVNLETKMVEYCQNKGYATGVIIEESDILREFKNRNFTCPSHNPSLLRFWINNEDAFAIKWKYVLPYLLFSNIKHHFFNYQLKYLHTAEYNLFKNKAELSGAFVDQYYFKIRDGFNIAL